MATLILSTAGAAIGGPVGSIIGAYIGGLIDQQLFGPDGPSGPQIDELRVPAFDPGMGAPWGFGPRARADCVYLWASDIREVTAGGKGGGKKDGEQIEYFADVAVGVMRRDINDFIRFWLGGRLIFDKIDPAALAGSDVTVNAFETFREDGVTVEDYFIDISAPDAGTDLSELLSGEPVKTGGFTNAANNTTPAFGWKCVYSFDDGASGTGARLRRIEYADGAGVDESSGASVTIDQNKPDRNRKLVGDIRLYKGLGAEGIDPIYTTHFGAGNEPRHLGTAWMMLEDLNVTPWGASLPEASCLTEPDAAPFSLESAIIAAATRSERLTTNEIDASTLSAITVDGYVTSGLTPPVQILRQLMFFYHLDVQERGGKLVFFKRDAAEIITVPNADIGARRADGSGSRKFQESYQPGSKIPAGMLVNYIDANRDHQPDQRQYRPQGGTSTAGVRRIGGPVVFNADNALALGKASYWELRMRMQRCKFSLPPSYLRVIEGDRLRLRREDPSPSVDDFREERDFRVTKVDRAKNGLITGDGHWEYNEVFTQSGDADPAPGLTGDLDHASDITAVALDIPAIQEDEVQRIILRVGAALSDPSDIFPGAAVHESKDSGTSYDLVESFSVGVFAGVAVNALGDHTTPYTTIDAVNTLNVVFDDPGVSLSNLTDAQSLSDEFLLLVGKEIMSWRTAAIDVTPPSGTHPSAKVYDLSDFVRGRRGTDIFTGSHAVGERVYLLQPKLLNRETFQASIGQTYQYVATPPGGAIADNTERIITIVGETSRPHAPDTLGVALNTPAANDLRITWNHRSRWPNFGSLDERITTPQVEAVRQWRIRIYADATFAVIKRTVSPATIGNDTEQFDYLSADQITDFGVNQTTLHLQIEQVGAIIDPGNVHQESVVGV